MASVEWDVADGKLAIWERRWKDDQLRWHKFQVNPYLIKYMDILTSEKVLDWNAVSATKNLPGAGTHQIYIANEEVKVGSFKKFFVPLCGKTMDIAYILSLGHSVFAIEGVKEAIESLDQENSFGLVYDPNESIYSTNDERLKIYFGNIFTCPIEKWGPFDCIWDRGSLTALEIGFRSAYKDILKRSVQGGPRKCQQKFRYLLQAFLYDKTKSDGRGPKCVDNHDMELLYGDWADFKLLESIQLPKEHVIRKMVKECTPNSDIDIDNTSCETVNILTNKNT